jgi:hypothetical protein
MARPSLWRWEFQQVESEYMGSEKKGRAQSSTTLGGENARASHISVTGAQHGRKAGSFHFAALSLAGLFKMPVVAYFLQRPFAIDLFL